MAANVEAVTVSNSTPRANENAKIAPRSASEPEHLSKLGSATRESQATRHAEVPVHDRRRPANSTETHNVVSKAGLTTDEARRRLAKYGPNAMPDTSAHPMRMALEKFWAPVPWMPEAAIVVELALGKYVEAGIPSRLLLVFDADALGRTTARLDNPRRTALQRHRPCLRRADATSSTVNVKRT